MKGYREVSLFLLGEKGNKVYRVDRVYTVCDSKCAIISSYS